MNWVHLIDWLTGISSFGVKFIGFPSQVRKNRRMGQAGDGAGTTITIAAVMTYSYAMWVLDGAVTDNWTLILSQGIGVLTMGTLLVQAIWYHHRMRMRQDEVAFHRKVRKDMGYFTTPHKTVTIVNYNNKKEGKQGQFFVFNPVDWQDDVH